MARPAGSLAVNGGRRKKPFWFYFAGLLVLPVVVVGFLSPPSMSGASYLVALLLIWPGPALARRAPSRFQSVIRWAGPLLFVVTLVARMFAPESGQLTYEQVGQRSLPRIALARLAHERDLSGGASTLLNVFSVLPDRGGVLGPLFRETYDRMDAADENVASPLLATLLLSQTASSFDMLHYRVDEPVGTLVFLHGYGGNIASICWEVAQSAKAAAYDTLCPSTRTRGDWGSPGGRAILNAVLDQIRTEGPVVLAGLSAGARGAALLGPRVRRRIDGLVLIAGASRRAPRAGVPTLVVYGRSDAMFAPSVMRGYVERTRARSVALEGGHFILLSARDRVREEIQRFLEARVP